MALPVRNESDWFKVNVADAFMLKEYESIASAHFDSQAGVRQQFRFYLLIAAVPVTIVGLAFRDQSEHDVAHWSLAGISPLFGDVFLGIGFIGVCLLLSMIHTALDATLYARTVNGIRAYFMDRGAAVEIGLDRYLKMPRDQNRPLYFHVRAFFWQVVLVSIINSTYISLFAFSRSKSLCITSWVLVPLVITQIGMYRWFCFLRQKKEISGSTRSAGD
jgi:undecaprenyl pyrophosphate phosphatase UppP